MSQTLEMTIEFANVAELLQHLGDVPAERIRLQPHPGTATVADAVRNNEQKRRPRVELVDGVLLEKVMGFGESRLAAVLIQLLGNFSDEQELGIVLAPDGMMEISPDLVRIPDVSFISWESLPGGEVPPEPCPKLAPDLAIEVISRSNTPAEMERKRREYFAAGVKLVWYLYPETKTMDVFTSASPDTAITETETVDGEDVLPGFRLSLSELFAKATGGKGL